MDFSSTIVLTTQIVTLFVIITGYTKYANLNTYQLRPFFYLLIISLLSDQFCIFMAYSNIETKWVTSIYTLFEFNIILFSLGSWMGRIFFSKFIRYLSAAYFLFWCVELSLLPDEPSCDLSDALEAMFMIILLSVYLLKLSKEVEGSILVNPVFWIASGLLIYFSATIVIVGTQAMVTDSGTKLQVYSWEVHNIIHIFATLLFLKGFLCIKDNLTYSL